MKKLLKRAPYLVVANQTSAVLRISRYAPDKILNRRGSTVVLSQKGKILCVTDEPGAIPKGYSPLRVDQRVQATGYFALPPSAPYAEGDPVLQYSDEAGRLFIVPVADREAFEGA